MYLELKIVRCFAKTKQKYWVRTSVFAVFFIFCPSFFLFVCCLPLFLLISFHHFCFPLTVCPVVSCFFEALSLALSLSLSLSLCLSLSLSLSLCLSLSLSVSLSLSLSLSLSVSLSLSLSLSVSLSLSLSLCDLDRLRVGVCVAPLAAHHDDSVLLESSCFFSVLYYYPHNYVEHRTVSGLWSF